MNAMWLAILIGFLICLGVAGWIFVHFIRSSLNNEDSTRIDPLPKNQDAK